MEAIFGSLPVLSEPNNGLSIGAILRQSDEIVNCLIASGGSEEDRVRDDAERLATRLSRKRKKVDANEVIRRKHLRRLMFVERDPDFYGQDNHFRALFRCSRQHFEAIADVCGKCLTLLGLHRNRLVSVFVCRNLRKIMLHGLVLCPMSDRCGWIYGNACSACSFDLVFRARCGKRRLFLVSQGKHFGKRARALQR